MKPDGCWNCRHWQCGFELSEPWPCAAAGDLVGGMARFAPHALWPRPMMAHEGNGCPVHATNPSLTDYRAQQWREESE